MEKIFLYLILSAYILISCNHSTSSHSNQADNDIHNHKTEEAHSDEIILPKEKAQASGVKIETIEPKNFNQIIKTSGQISGAQGDESTIVATVPGVIAFGKTRIVDGSYVAAGTTLASISSKNIVDGDQTEKLRIAYESAETELKRANSLIKDKIISEKEYNQIKQNFETARIAYEATGNRLGVKGVTVISPISGYIKNKLVNEGDYVTTGQPLLSISQNKKLILRADLSERNYKALPTIRTANFKTPYDNKIYELPQLNGRMVSYGKSSGNNSFYIPVTFEFDNKGDIIPGAFVEVYLLSAPIEKALVLPITSLTEEQGAYFVYIQLDEDGYKKQEVQIGANNGKDVQILSGIKAGDRVVAEGAYQIKLAAKSNIIPEGHSHSH